MPTLLYVTADNQKDVAVNLEKNGAVKIVKNLKKDIEYFMKDIKAWRNMSNNACKVSDGLGVTRVVEKIFSICTRKKNVI